jgi:hypothetical protein
MALLQSRMPFEIAVISSNTCLGSRAEPSGVRQASENIRSARITPFSFRSSVSERPLTTVSGDQHAKTGRNPLSPSQNEFLLRAGQMEGRAGEESKTGRHDRQSEAIFLVTGSR